MTDTPTVIIEHEAEPKPRSHYIPELTASQKTAEAHKRLLVAKRKRLNVRDEQSPFIKRCQLADADSIEEVAKETLALTEITERGTGGELAPSFSHGLPGMTLAVKDPDHVSLNASIDRVNLIDKSGVFDMALDAAETVGARNATEQMLAHQMAVTHRAALELLMKAGNMKDPVEQCRLSNTAARLMETYQKAMLTMQRMHTGGQQFVTVQHVQVKDGGQAIINGVGVTSDGGSGRK